MERKYIEEYDKICKIYTADDEEPNCVKCDHQFSDTMCAMCGPEHSWNWYKRNLMPEEWKNER